MLSLDFNERLVSKLQDYFQIDAGYNLLAECRIVLEGNQNMLRLLPCAKFPSLKAYNSNHHHSDKFPHPGHKSSTGPEIPANLWKFHLWISFVGHFKVLEIQ